ncbi:unnamed protein product, partial [Ixodes persulcatus]
MPVQPVEVHGNWNGSIKAIVRITCASNLVTHGTFLCESEVHAIDSFSKLVIDSSYSLVLSSLIRSHQFPADDMPSLCNAEVLKAPKITDRSRTLSKTNAMLLVHTTSDLYAHTPNIPLTCPQAVSNIPKNCLHKVHKSML